MSNFNERVRQRRKELGLTQKDVAKRAGVPQSTIGQIEGGRNKSTKKIIELARALAVSPEYLLYGTPPITTTEATNQAPPTTASWAKRDTVKIDVYDNVRFFAGDGNPTDALLYKNGQNLETTTLQFPVADFLRSGADPEQSVCVKLSGDSMSPLIPDGATIGIDKSKTQAKDGSIHAFWHGGMLRVKELQILPNNKVRIKSYNPKYDDECASIDELIIVGRVFWWSVLVML